MDNNCNQFEKVTRVKDDPRYILPRRATAASAGYDFFAPDTVEIQPGQTVKIDTGIKVRLSRCLFLQLHMRSSMGIKRQLTLANCTGIIDADYYNNPDNEGEIIFVIKNVGTEPQTIKQGEPFAQGIILGYFVTSDDEPVHEQRTGGIGSTTS